MGILEQETAVMMTSWIRMPSIRITPLTPFEIVR
jgi:hypothetical protein